MSSPLRLHDLAPSPNNMKVRLALNLKGIPYERVAIDPQNRASLVQLSGQPLAPVIEHDGKVLFDSHAIVRYLQANFRRGPHLFSRDRTELRMIEDWERAARGPLSEPVAIIFGHFLGNTLPGADSERASELMRRQTAPIEEALADHDWLVGGRMTAADAFCAPFVWYSMVPAAAAEASVIQAFFREHLRLGEGRERTRAWAERCMAYDR